MTIPEEPLATSEAGRELGTDTRSADGVEIWQVAAVVTAENPGATYLGTRRRGENTTLPEPRIERFGDGSVLVTAWGTSETAAEEAWATEATIQLAKGQ